MKITNDRIHTQLSSLVNGSLRTYLQDAVITMRGDRYCIPVKSEHKAQVPGMIHDQSSTGSTLFIEPAAIVKLNNDMRELFLKEEQEILVILSTLSASCGEYIESLEYNYKILVKLDFIFAKSKLALEQNSSIPVYNEAGSIRIRGGRHPLLSKKSVVPIDIHLGNDFDLLIVTGPNTGGKTVSLKTVGLLSLMGQAGLHIPAKDRSELSIFHEIYADIGDEQSIEQSLSTFSSHMTNIVDILKHADRKSLCLFDELGAGTDPTEGAALAIAVLSYLHAKGIRTMATTHYSELKVFALTTNGVENACCEFDVETLRPTYRLLIGVPGKSNAFAISSKLGLPDYIIEDAKTHLSEADENFEDLLSSLEQSRVTIENERSAIADYKREIETLKEKLEKKQDKLEEARDKILNDAREEARNILRDAKETADETIKHFQKFGDLDAIRSMEKDRTKLREKIDKNNINQKNTQEKKRTYLKPEDLKRGDSVRVLSIGVKGTVSSLPDAKGNLYVQCGILRSQVNYKDLVLLDEEVITAPNLQRTGSGKVKLSKSSTISIEINLIGKTVDEALATLDKYLDDAYLSHLPSVRVVHGKGTGALRNAVHSHLKRVKYVSEYHLGAFGEGDAGVTIVTFK
jgi:DNA mismatch repair protein MutS2